MTVQVTTELHLGVIQEFPTNFLLFTTAFYFHFKFISCHFHFHFFIFIVDTYLPRPLAVIERLPTLH